MTVEAYLRDLARTDYVYQVIHPLMVTLKVINARLACTSEDEPMRAEGIALFEKLEVEALVWLPHVDITRDLYRRIAVTGSAKLLEALPIRPKREVLAESEINLSFLRHLGPDNMRLFLKHFIVGHSILKCVIDLAEESRDWLALLAEIDTDVVSRHEMPSLLGAHQFLATGLTNMMKNCPRVMPRVLARQISVDPSLGHRLIERLIEQGIDVPICLPILISCGAELRLEDPKVRLYFSTHTFSSNHERAQATMPRKTIQAIAQTPWGVPGDPA